MNGINGPGGVRRTALLRKVPENKRCLLGWSLESAWAGGAEKALKELVGGERSREGTGQTRRERRKM